MKKQIIVILIEEVVLLLLVLGCIFLHEKRQMENIENGNPMFADAAEIPLAVPENMLKTKDNVVVEEETCHASLTAVGDIMMHSWQINRGYDAATDTFDYMESFTYVADYLSAADFTFGNLETTFAGRYNGASSDVLGYADYPMFNSPEVLGNNLKDLGFDMLATANNHSLDSWEDGVYATLDHLDSLGIKHVGTARSQAEKDELCIVEVNGITFGFSCYTYATNGLPVPSNAPYCVNTLEMYDEACINEMCNNVKRLNEAGVDVVMPIIHFGTEYRVPTDSYQEMCVDRLFEAGADVIIGSHPHVVESMEIREITNPDGSKRTGYVIYSMGNFISSQIYEPGVMKDIGVILDMEFEKQGNQTYITEWKFTPVYVYWKDDVIGVVPVVEAYENREKYSFLSEKDWGRIADSYSKTIETLNSKSNRKYEIIDYKYCFDVYSEISPE